MSVKQIDVPSYSGSFGILPNHVPSLAVIKPGVVTVYEEGGATKKFFGNLVTEAMNNIMIKKFFSQLVAEQSA